VASISFASVISSTALSYLGVEATRTFGTHEKIVDLERPSSVARRARAADRHKALIPTSVPTFMRICC